MSQLPPMHAFLVGNGCYENKEDFPDLDYAPNDANHLYNLLTTSESAIFNKNTSCLNRDLNLRELEDRFADFIDPVDRSDLVLFYFAGHAYSIPGGKQLFLIMRNSNPNSLARSAFLVDRLIPFFVEKKLRRYMVILDCCHAQKALDSLEIRTRGLKNDFESPDWCGYGKVFIAAARDYQLANELNHLKHGLFSFYFAKGIETGEAAESTKQWINITDLSAYVAKQIALNHPGINQEPKFSGEDILGELIIAKNLRFNHSESYMAEFLEFHKKSLNLSDLSDRDKVQAARIVKLRKFMDLLKDNVKDKFLQLRAVVVEYGQILGVDKEQIDTEFDSCVAAMAFEASVSMKNLPAISEGYGRAVLFSAAHGMLATESPEFNSGLFSYYFREALKGKASNVEGVVTLSSCFHFLQTYVRGYEHFKQHPVLISNLTGDPILTGKGIDWAKVPSRRIALLVGINEYNSHEIPPLAYAESDVQALKEILQKLGGFECYVMIGTQATGLAVESVVQKLLSQLSKEDFFLFYFSGHGFATETDGYAVLYDSDYIMKTRILPFTTLNRSIAESANGTSLIILDTCMAPAEMPVSYIYEGTTQAIKYHRNQIKFIRT